MADRCTDIVAQINRVTTLPELAELAGLAESGLTKQLAAINAEIAAIAPLVALATASFSTLPQVVSFLVSLQSALCGPAVIADAKLAAQLAQVAVCVAEIAAAVAAAESRIGG